MSDEIPPETERHMGERENCGGMNVEGCPSCGWVGGHMTGCGRPELTRQVLAEARLAIAVEALKQIRDSLYDHSCRWCGDPRETARGALSEIEGRPE